MRVLIVFPRRNIIEQAISGFEGLTITSCQSLADAEIGWDKAIDAEQPFDIVICGSHFDEDSPCELLKRMYRQLPIVQFYGLAYVEIDEQRFKEAVPTIVSFLCPDSLKKLGLYLADKIPLKSAIEEEITSQLFRPKI